MMVMTEQHSGAVNAREQAAAKVAQAALVGKMKLPKTRESYHLESHDVDLWKIRLPIPETAEALLLMTLSHEEQHRAHSSFSKKSRNQFIAGRGVLRQIVSRYLNVQSSDIRFSIGSQGKLTLVGNHPLHFNLSHTDGLLLVAISGGLEIGVDVEKIRPIDGARELASRYFTPCERATMGAGPEEFFRLWTSRESAVKALGVGVSLGWEAIRIVDRGGDEADALGLGVDCHIRVLSPKPGYIAALCALAPDFRLRQIRTLPFLAPLNRWNFE